MLLFRIVYILGGDKIDHVQKIDVLQLLNLYKKYHLDLSIFD